MGRAVRDRGEGSTGSDPGAKFHYEDPLPPRTLLQEALRTETTFNSSTEHLLLCYQILLHNSVFHESLFHESSISYFFHSSFHLLLRPVALISFCLIV